MTIQTFNQSVLTLDNNEQDWDRSIDEIVTGSGFSCTLVTRFEDFLVKFQDPSIKLGIIAYEQLGHQPKFRLEQLRAAAPQKTLVVVYNGASAGIQLGKRMWEIGVIDFFIPRSDSPFRFKSVIRQTHYDSYIKDCLGQYQNEPFDRDGQDDLTLLHELGPALLKSKNFSDLWRTLFLRVPQIVDTAAIIVLLVENDSLKIYSLHFLALEQEFIWSLTKKVCEEAERFYQKNINISDVQFSDPISYVLTSKNKDKCYYSTETADAVAMVNHGNFIGCIGLASPPAKGGDHRQIRNLLIPLALHLCTAIVNIKLLQEIEGSSYVDELTGAFNRRYLKNFLEREWVRVKRYGSNISLALIDLDHFKKFNDTYGHLQGDLVLQQFTNFVTKQMRSLDRLIRYGGEEFLLVLLEVDAVQAALTLERIRSKLQSDSLETIRIIGPLLFSFSVGIASFPECGLADITPEQLIECADKALYMAKNNGRNQICVYQIPNKINEDSQNLENRKYQRTKCRLKIRFVELPHYTAHHITTTILDLSAGGLRIQDPERKLRKNSHILIHLGEQLEPNLCKVIWIRDINPGERQAGLEFVKSSSLENNTDVIEPKRRALVICKDKFVRERLGRILMASRYEVEFFNEDESTISKELLQEYPMVIIGESLFRKEVAFHLQQLGISDKNPRKVILINEVQDRSQAVKKIQESKVDHFISSDENSMEALFAGINKIFLGEIFGIKKYLLWGADSMVWPVENLSEKNVALSGIQEYAANVKCHPRIINLLIMAVDEMLINALYSIPGGATNSIVSVECGSDGRLLIVSVTDERGMLESHDVFRSLGKALELSENGIGDHEKNAHMGFHIMLSTLSQLSININPGKCTEIIGIVDLRMSLKDYRSMSPAFNFFKKHK